MTDLKPCPFCGGEGTYSADNRITDDEFYAYVECDTCHCTSSFADTASQAIKLWNIRQPAIDWRPIEELGYREDQLLIYDKRFRRYLIVSFENPDITKELILINGYFVISLEKAKQEYTHFAELTPPKS